MKTMLMISSSKIIALLSILLLAKSVLLAQGAATDVPQYKASPTGKLNGELRKWHKITLGFEGPSTSEVDSPNPFTDYRLDVTFTDKSSSQYVVPGYFAADGNAANSGATAGNIWLIHFAPDKTGLWSWEASFVTGTNVAMNGGGSSAGYFDGTKGSFNVEGTNKTGRDHRAKGRLQYVGQHHLQFAETKEWFLKAGADSPENFLAYEDFDNTPDYGNRRKSWSPHEQDYNTCDPTWNNNTCDPTWARGKGKAIVGAINYLADKGMNVFSFIPMNIQGDDRNVYPYISDRPGDDRLRIDVSKIAQWEVLFEHADHIGMYLHFKMQEIENAHLLDGGDLGIERKLYYRELIARFSHHLALNWNIGEENTNTDQQRKDFADFIKQIDPYKHPVVVHSGRYAQNRVYNPLLGYPSYDGVSIQKSTDDVFSETLEWVEMSANAGRKWVVANDEQQGGVDTDDNDPDHDVYRKDALWGNIMAGGAGIEYYLQGDDLDLEDFRSRANMWDQSRHALEFFQDNDVPFWDMTNANGRVSTGNWCLAQSNDENIVVYLKNGGPSNIDLSGASGITYTVKWFDPRNGGSLQDGSVTSLVGGSTPSLGAAPNEQPGKDWTVLLRSDVSPQPSQSPGPRPTPSKQPTGSKDTSPQPSQSPKGEPSQSPGPRLTPSKQPTGSKDASPQPSRSPKGEPTKRCNGRLSSCKKHRECCGKLKCRGKKGRKKCKSVCKKAGRTCKRDRQCCGGRCKNRRGRLPAVCY